MQKLDGKNQVQVIFFFFYIVTGCNEIIVLNPKISPVIVEDYVLFFQDIN